MSFVVMAWAMQQTTGSATRKAVLLALADRVNQDTGLCCPSVEAISAQTEIADRAVRTALKDLCDAGLITRTRTRRSDGSLGVYEFAFPEWSDAAQPPAAGAASPPAAGAGHNLEEDLQPEESEADASLSSAPAKRTWTATKIEGRDMPFDRLAAVTGVQDGSRRQKEVAVALNGRTRPGELGIREQFWRELEIAGIEPTPGPVFEQALAEEIEMRCERYRAVMPGAMLTPTALAKWWTDLPDLTKPLQRRYGRGVTSAEILEATRGRE